MSAETSNNTFVNHMTLNGNTATLDYIRDLNQSQTIPADEIRLIFGKNDIVKGMTAETSGAREVTVTFPRTICNTEHPKPVLWYNTETVRSSGTNGINSGPRFANPVGEGSPVYTFSYSTDDTCPPRLAKAVGKTSGVDLEYHEDLDTAHTPAVSAFSISYDGTDRPISAVSISGKKVTLKLTTTLSSFTGKMLVSYTPPSSNAIQDDAENEAYGFTDQPATADGVIGPPTALEHRYEYPNLTDSEGNAVVSAVKLQNVRGDRPTTLASNDMIQCAIYEYEVDDNDTPNDASDDTVTLLDSQNHERTPHNGTNSVHNGGNLWSYCDAQFVRTGDAPYFTEWWQRIYDASEDEYSAWSPVVRNGTRPSSTSASEPVITRSVEEPSNSAEIVNPPTEPPIKQSTVEEVVDNTPFTFDFNLPETHDGTAFITKLTFSKEVVVPDGYLSDGAFNVENGAVTQVKAVGEDNRAWNITITPASNAFVRVDFYADEITAKSNGEPMLSGVSAGIRYVPLKVSQSQSEPSPEPAPEPTPEPTPFTASWSPPASHNGDAFTFRLSLSEQPAKFSFRYMKFTAVTATNGTVLKTKRATRGENQHWDITIQPNGPGPVSVAFDGPAIVSAANGTKLSTSLAAQVPDSR